MAFPMCGRSVHEFMHFLRQVVVQAGTGAFGGSHELVSNHKERVSAFVRPVTGTIVGVNGVWGWVARSLL